MEKSTKDIAFIVFLVEHVDETYDELTEDRIEGIYRMWAEAEELLDRSGMLRLAERIEKVVAERPKSQYQMGDREE